MTIGSKIKVLVVDDSAYSRQTIKKMLETDKSIEVIGIASDGIDAMAKTLRLRPDLITLDFEMPEMDGFSFLRWLMKEKPTPVIMVSSYSDTKTVFKALELGAVDFIAKPTQRASAELRGIEKDLLNKVRGVKNLNMDKLSKNQIGGKIEGIEYSKDAIVFGKKLFPNLTFKEGSIYELPYKNNSFDLVICTEVLEHLEEPTKALKEILRVSRKYLIISVPNEPLFMLSNFLRGKNLLRLGNDEGHINNWNPLSLKKYLKKNGLKIERIRLPFPWITIIATK